MLRIKLCSIFVDDQTKALRFYTDVLGFAKSREIPVGEFRWLTVRSADGDDVELSLEPNANPAARTYQQALLAQGIPATAFEVDDIDAEYARLRRLGVEFKGPPAEMGPVKQAVLLDTCGNLIMLYQPPRSAT
jgi:glyoxylase I family protein